MSVLVSSPSAAPSASLQSPRPLSHSFSRMINRPLSSSSSSSHHRPSPPPAPAPAPGPGPAPPPSRSEAGPPKAAARAQPPAAQPPTPTSAPATSSPSMAVQAAGSLAFDAAKKPLAAFHPSRLQAIPPFKVKAAPGAPGEGVNMAKLLRPGMVDRSAERRTSMGDFPSVLAPAAGGQGLGIVGVDVLHGKAPEPSHKRRSSAMDHAEAAKEASYLAELNPVSASRPSGSRPSSSGSYPTTTSPEAKRARLDPFASLLTAASALAPSHTRTDADATKRRAGPSSSSARGLQGLNDALHKLERSKAEREREAAGGAGQAEGGPGSPTRRPGQLNRERAKNLTIITQARRGSELDGAGLKSAPVRGGMGMPGLTHSHSDGGRIPSVLVPAGANPPVTAYPSFPPPSRSSAGSVLKPGPPRGGRRVSTIGLTGPAPQAGAAYPSVIAGPPPPSAGGHHYAQTAHPGSDQRAHYIREAGLPPSSRGYPGPPPFTRRTPPQPGVYHFPAPAAVSPRDSRNLASSAPSPPSSASAHNPSNPGVSKASFLSLFSTFFDSLADSRVLARSLEEQTRKAGSLLGALGEAGRVFEEVMERRLDEFGAEQREGMRRVEERVARIEAKVAAGFQAGEAVAGAVGMEALLARLEQLERRLEDGPGKSEVDELEHE